MGCVFEILKQIISLRSELLIETQYSSIFNMLGYVITKLTYELQFYQQYHRLFDTNAFPIGFFVLYLVCLNGDFIVHDKFTLSDKFIMYSIWFLEVLLRVVGLE